MALSTLFDRNSFGIVRIVAGTIVLDEKGTLESCSATADISIVTVTTPTELSVQAGANVKLPCIFISSEEISTATSVTWSFQQKGSTARPITVSAVEVYTPAELSVENGTEAKLQCTFTSTEVVSSEASVTWSFQAEGSSPSVSFFYYSNGKQYPAKTTQFKDRTNWAGDLNKKDASIAIANMQFQDNGTYICDVKNPPDIVVTPGEIKLRVVEKERRILKSIILAVSFSKGLQYRAVRSRYRRKIGNVTGLGLLFQSHYISCCSTSESLVSPVKQAPRKSPSDTEGLVNSVPIRSHQGPVIYAQLDHSGGHCSDKINKSESVVYADIRKN
ncbi:myelin protein zero-like protein 1 isoform X2 [Varanus komodoensis]|uniref:myelin protein zero-like protein 1 isoform X2 n=1 Tax=Varanus komodoensis TaxID=61221 RepID=UPI001CF7A842|nr:myelin protein zero-like protein 1 isoform X2 [Varanus komodoensis]